MSHLSAEPEDDALTPGTAIAEQIIDAHLSPDGERVHPGELVTVRPDHIYVQDGNTPTLARLYREYGFDSVFDPTRVSFVFDHSVLVANVDMADRMKEADEFARRLGVDVRARGTGISHVIAAELGWFRPGSLILGSDSHTCAGGSRGSLGLGMGVSDIAAAMLTGRTWLRVPETVVVDIVGRPHPATRPRDVVLSLLRDHGQGPFLYRAVEYDGPWAHELSSDGASSLASLGVELGAKCTFVPDAEGAIPTGTDLASPRISYDVSDLGPVVSRPHLPANVVALSEAAGTRIDYTFLGTCTNGRFEDIAEAAEVVAGRHIAPGLQFVITPGSRQVYRDALSAGHVDTLMDAGAVVTPPGCGACVGTQGPLPARGDNVLATMNRNFRGRMGNPEADIYLSSPRVVATAALIGAIPSLEELS